jgi:membrane-bound ClpP family serine protease
MLFLFRGQNGPLVRSILGAILLVVGVVVHGAALLAGIGVVLLIWGGMGWLSSQRTRRQQRLGNCERVS